MEIKMITGDWIFDENGRMKLDAVCDMCGQPATNKWIDPVEVTLPKDKVRNYRPGKIHYGCDEHSPPPIEES